jgi:hypothetical protein
MPYVEATSSTSRAARGSTGTLSADDASEERRVTSTILHQYIAVHGTSTRY